MVVNGRLTKVNERAGSLQGQRMRVRVRQHVVGRLSVASAFQLSAIVLLFLLVLLSRCSSPPLWGVIRTRLEGGGVEPG